MIVADASFWVSAMMPEELFHSASRQFADTWTQDGRQVHIPTIFVAEVAGALTRNRSPLAEVPLNLFAALYAPSFVHRSIGPELERRAAEIAATSRLRGADAVYVALADQLSLPLVTWDNEQLERGGQVVHALTPEQALKELL